MDQSVLNRNGGYSKDNTGIITAWKMKMAIGIGCFDQDITVQINRINGLFMDFLREMSLSIIQAPCHPFSMSYRFPMSSLLPLSSRRRRDLRVMQIQVDPVLVMTSFTRMSSPH